MTCSVIWTVHTDFMCCTVTSGPGAAVDTTLDALHVITGQLTMLNEIVRATPGISKEHNIWLKTVVGDFHKAVLEAVKHVQGVVDAGGDSVKTGTDGTRNLVDETEKLSPYALKAGEKVGSSGLKAAEKVTSGALKDGANKRDSNDAVDHQSEDNGIQNN